MNNFPIEIAEKILLLTENPCRYNRVSKTWYRATKKNNFWYKYISTRYQQDFGPLFNYYNAWVSSGGDLLNMSKIHYDGKYAQEKHNWHTINNLPDLNEVYALENHLDYPKIFRRQPRIKLEIFNLNQSIQIDLGIVNIMLRGTNLESMSGGFGQFSLVRSRENEKFFAWYTDLESRIEKSMSKNGTLKMKKRVCDPDNKWLNINMISDSNTIYSARIVPDLQSTECPVMINNMIFSKSTVWHQSVSPIIPADYKWYGPAHVIFKITSMWINTNGMYGLSLGPQIIFLPDKLPPILQEPFQNKFKSNLIIPCVCRECISNKKWEKYIEQNNKFFGTQKPNDYLGLHEELPDELPVELPDEESLVELPDEIIG